MDVVAFHLVTVGRRASEYSHELFKADNYSDYLYFHGLSVESAEALAELWHKRIREELGNRGRRFARVDAIVQAGVPGFALQFRLSGVSATRRSGETFHVARPGRIDVNLTKSFSWSRNNRLRLLLSTIRRPNTSRSNEPLLTISQRRICAFLSKRVASLNVV
jgi:cobalamin-dependent methionine synthase I